MICFGGACIKEYIKLTSNIRIFWGVMATLPRFHQAHHLPVSIKENTFLQSSFHLDVDFLQLLFIHVRCWRLFFYYLENFVILWLWGRNFFFFFPDYLRLQEGGVSLAIFPPHCFQVRKLSNF